MALSESVSAMLARSGYDDQQALEAAGLMPEVRAADLAKDIELVKKSGLYNVFDTDSFQMYCYKVLPCTKTYRHNWQACPFAHMMERARRRDPRTCLYTDEFCDYAKKKKYCPKGDGCAFAHNLLELWLHPNRYRTIMCKDRKTCNRELCFFAHSESQLRKPTIADFELSDLSLKPPSSMHSDSKPGVGAYVHGLRATLDALAAEDLNQRAINNTPSLPDQRVNNNAPRQQGGSPTVSSAMENTSAELLLALLKVASNAKSDSPDCTNSSTLPLDALHHSGVNVPSALQLLTQSTPGNAPPQVSSDMLSNMLQHLASLALDSQLQGTTTPPPLHPPVSSQQLLRDSVGMSASGMSRPRPSVPQQLLTEAGNLGNGVMWRPQVSYGDSYSAAMLSMSPPAVSYPSPLRTGSGSAGMAMGYPVQSEPSMVSGYQSSHSVPSTMAHVMAQQPMMMYSSGML